MSRHQNLCLCGDTKRWSQRQPGTAPDFGIFKDQDMSHLTKSDWSFRTATGKKEIRQNFHLLKEKICGEFKVGWNEHFILILAVLTNNQLEVKRVNEE